MYKLTIQPILDPCRVFVFIIDGAFSFFKKGLIHIAFGSGYKCHIKSIE